MARVGGIHVTITADRAAAALSAIVQLCYGNQPELDDSERLAVIEEIAAEALEDVTTVTDG